MLVRPPGGFSSTVLMAVWFQSVTTSAREGQAAATASTAKLSWARRIRVLDCDFFFMGDFVS